MALSGCGHVHRSFNKPADARRDADQKVGRWLLHGDHLDGV